MVFYCIMFILVCVLAFAIACVTEMYSERAKEKASADVKTEALKDRSISCRTHSSRCNYTRTYDELKKAG